MLIIPRLYAIVDAATLAGRGIGVREFAAELRTSGVTLVQWRCKGSPQDVLDGARMLREVFAGTACTMVMNDRVDLAVIAGFDGVHVGQEDLAVADVRRAAEVCGGKEFVVGVSTHADEQVLTAEGSAADYVAIGPVFATGTKANAAEPVGLEGVRRARALTTKPLVAIGGITLENAPSVMQAGADAVAVISGLFVPQIRVRDVARKFLEMT